VPQHAELGLQQQQQQVHFQYSLARHTHDSSLL
jgi:hypothetical protein